MDQDTDEEAFLLLDEETIRNLIHKIGPRLKFLKLFRELVGTNLVEYLLRSDKRPYPSVLALGEPQQCATQSFVILAGQALPQNTLLGAVDVCFKAFYVFDINCPKQCAPAWEVLQHVVYNIIEGPESKQAKFFRTAIVNLQ
ncbi:hypothetical protein GJAV_G00187990 [Gymnothorax javanicus]|nr:hypothetical protein GJAV_G00187990 [Gymnothorax javanicus]